MKEIKIFVNSRGNVSNILKMIEEFKQLGVFDEKRNVVLYDEKNSILSQKVIDIFDKYHKEK